MRRAAQLAAAAVVAITGRVHAQILQVPGNAAEVGASYEGVRNVTAGDAAVTGHELREWLALPVAGSLLDRDLFSYQFTLRPTWQQRTQTGFATTLQARQLNLSGSVRMLSRFPVNLAATAVRQSGTGAGGVGSLTEFDAGMVRADAFWRNRAFPMQLSVLRQSTDQRWRNSFSGDTQRLAQVTRSVRLSASSSKLHVDLQRLQNDDRVGGADFVARSGNLTHTFRWGRGSTLETRLEYGDQEGGFAFLRRSWMERLRVRHGRRTTSEHSYRGANVRTSAGDSRSSAWSSGVTTEVAPRVSAGLRYAASTAQTAAARDVVQTLAPRLGVRVPLAPRVTASASGSLGWERRRRAGGEIAVPIIDEPHTVDATRRFTLDAPDPDPTSVIVRSGDGTVVYVEGTDYTLLPIGETLQVDVPPGSRISPGATVLVSYRHAVPDSRGENATLGEYELSVQARGLDVRHRRMFRNSRVVEVGAPLPGLADFDDRFTSLTLRGPVPLGSASVEGTFRQRERADQRTTEWNTSAGLTPRPVGGVQFTLTAFWSATRSGDAEATTVGAGASVSGRAAPGLFLRAQLDALRWTQSATVPQRFLSGSLDIDWRFDNVEIAGRVEVHRRWLLQTNTMNRATVRVVRRF